MDEKEIYKLISLLKKLLMGVKFDYATGEDHSVLYLYIIEDSKVVEKLSFSLINKTFKDIIKEVKRACDRF